MNFLSYASWLCGWLIALGILILAVIALNQQDNQIAELEKKLRLKNWLSEREINE